MSLSVQTHPNRSLAEAVSDLTLDALILKEVVEGKY